MSSAEGPAPTLLVVLAHPDDEVIAAGTLMAQRAAGSRVVVLWLTRGEMTEGFGPIPPEEVSSRRTELGHQAGELLGIETRFLDLPDTRLEPTADATDQVARVICDVKPDGLLTWGDAWVRGFRHPDHRSAGQLARDAITIARIRKRVDPSHPHRGVCPVFTYRDTHSTLPSVGLDVEPYVDTIFALARLYRDALGFGDREWLEGRLRATGARWGCRFAEEFDAWESGDGLVPRLLPQKPGLFHHHPDRARS